MNPLQVRGIKYPSLRAYKSMLFTQVCKPLQFEKDQEQLPIKNNLKYTENDQNKKQPKDLIRTNKQLSLERRNFLIQFLKICNLQDDVSDQKKLENIQVSSGARESCSRFIKSVKSTKDFIVKKSRSLSQMKQRSSSISFRKEEILTSKSQKKKKNVHFYEKVEFLVMSDEESVFLKYRYFEPLK